MPEVMTYDQALGELNQVTPQSRELSKELEEVLNLAGAVRTALRQLGIEEDRISSVEEISNGNVVVMYDGTKVIATPNLAAPYHYDVKLAA